MDTTAVGMAISPTVIVAVDRYEDHPLVREVSA